MQSQPSLRNHPQPRKLFVLVVLLQVYPLRQVRAVVAFRVINGIAILQMQTAEELLLAGPLHQVIPLQIAAPHRYTITVL